MSLTNDLFSPAEAPVPVNTAPKTKIGKAPAVEIKSAALQQAASQATSTTLVGEKAVTPVSERKTPELWLRFLSSVPRPFRGAVLESTWQIHDDVLSSCQGSAETPSALDKNSALNTAMSNVSYAAYLAYHLVKPEQMQEAQALLRKEPYEFSRWIKSQNPRADKVLVVGDYPKAEDVTTALDKQLDSNPARALLCGPGKAVEGILRAYGEARNYVKANLMSVDHDANGANWDQVPGRSLDKMVDRVFREMQPDRLIVFEPSRMPATLEVLSKARQLGLPILYVDGQDVIATAKSTLYAKL